MPVLIIIEKYLYDIVPFGKVGWFPKIPFHDIRYENTFE
jgi:hypothetical protein